jgi:DNA-binding transcriptional ArsR family regulator
MAVGSKAHAEMQRLAVLGDARRRDILETLSRGPCSVADIARRLPVTRSAVSQHLAVLRRAGLVRHEKRGTRHMYQLDPEGVAALRAYLESLWQQALTSFKDTAEAAGNLPAHVDRTGVLHRRRKERKR